MIVRFLIVVLLVQVKFLSAQVLIHKNLNIDDGLVYSQVLSIHEDQRGYLWFGTSSGISRWDGNRFENYLVADSLLDNNIKWIEERSDGTLYMVTRQGMVQFRNNRFFKIPNTPPELNDWIYDILTSADDILYIAVKKSGLWSYDGIQFKNIYKPEVEGFKKVYALCEGRDGEIFVAAEGNSIVAWADGRVKNIVNRFATEGLEFTALFQDNQNGLWIGTKNNGLFLYDDNGLIHFNLSNGLPSNLITHITEGEEKQVYVSTDNGIALFENQRPYTVLNTEKGLSNNFVWQIFKDQNNINYIATDGGGVDIYRPDLFQTINTDCGLPHNTVWSICETNDHTFYFATDKGLAQFKQDQLKVIDRSNGLSDNMVLSIFEGKDGSVYLGTNEQGVDILRNGRIENINASKGLDGPSVWAITEDSDGKIYFGTYDAGVNVWDGSRVTDTINVDDGLASQAITAAYHSPSQRLYFGTDGGGAFQLKNGHVDTTFLPGNTVWSVYEDSAANLYFGTNDNGMIYFRNGRWDTLNIQHGLSHNSILGIMQDDQDKFYLTADNGLNIVTFTDNGVHIRILGKKDGLSSNECNQGALYKDSQNYLWIGTIAGVSRYNPAKSKPVILPPRVQLIRFQLFDKDLDIHSKTESYTFEYDENYLKFGFTGIDLSAPHKIRYRYNLSGVDQGWVYTDHPNVQYTNLDDGDYIFRMSSGNEWDSWSEPQQVKFSIAAPFWERWWFIVLSFLILSGMVAFPIVYRVKHLLAVERLRSKIAADLHDDIGAGLSEINILNAVMEMKMPDEIKQKTYLERAKISSRVSEIINGMSDIVWLINPDKDSLYDLLNRLSDASAEMLEGKEISFNAHNLAALKKIHLKMEQRQNLLLLFKEAINNSAKYSGANSIDLSVQHTSGTLAICLTDDGRGFDLNAKTEGNGLTNIKRRARSAQGVLTIKTAAGAGTSITVKMKL